MFRAASALDARLSVEFLEQRHMLAGDPLSAGQPVIISELLADNNTTLSTRVRGSTNDSFGGEQEWPDWIELMNVSPDRIDLGNLHLTDDPAQPKQWAFPAGTFIEPGGYLLVMASGEDIRDPRLDEHGWLHTNFRLSADGDYLALTHANGEVLHELSPTFPAQRIDTSYALTMEASTLLGEDAAVEYLVPQSDQHEPAWRQLDFRDPHVISAPSGSPLGFDRGTGRAEPGETIGAEIIDRASVDFSRGSIVVLESAPFTITGRVTEWSVFSKVTQPITPLIFQQVGEEYQIVGIGATRLSNGSGAQTFAFDLQSGADLVEAEGYYFGFKDGDNVTDAPGVVRWGTGGAEMVRRYNGPLAGKMFVESTLTAGRDFQRTYSVRAVTQARLAGPLATDVDAVMAGASSLYVRYPFQVEDRSTLRALQLHVRYEDGFIAYLNGVEVARRNAPSTATYRGTAPNDRALADANRVESINISEHLDRLQTGSNLLAIHAFDDQAGGAEFLLDATLTSTVIADGNDFGFATAPTPNGPSGSLAQGLLASVQADQPRGFYDAPFVLNLSLPEGPPAAIYYTLDGTHPAPTNPSARLFTGNLEIGQTTTLRAAAYATDYLPSLPATFTYLFLDDVIQQETMSPVVTADPHWGPQMRASLLALPTISLVTADTIEVTGEQSVAMELIYPDGTPGFQVDAGIEVYGGTAVSFPKRSLRISFKKDYGPATLEYDLFDDPDGVASFNQILLRPGSHDTPFWNGSVGVGNYLRNRWASDRQAEMGHLAPRSQFVHVYINGEYWGQHDLMERPNGSFMAGNLGGSVDDYDALNAGTPIDGDLDNWNRLLQAVGESYAAVQQYLDVENYADYVLLQFFGGNNIDWGPASNWMAARKREAGAGFQFFAWDSDIILRSGLSTDIVNYPGPGFLWSINGGLQQYPEFLDLLAERAQLHFFAGGMFTNERFRATLDALAAEMQLSVIAETARWGSGRYTPDTWQAAVDWIKDTYAPAAGPSRAEIVIEQMRHAGLFPLADTPVLRVDGQLSTATELSSESTVQLSAEHGSIVYTLDGTDPRADTPTLSEQFWVADGATAWVTVPTDNGLADTWHAPDFDDSSWLRGVNGVGYDTSGVLTPNIATDIQSQMKDINSTAYIRLPFEVSSLEDVETLRLEVQYDDGFVAYLNGVEIARRNAPAPVAWNSRSVIPRANNEQLVFEPFNLTRELQHVRVGTNVLAIQALNSEPANLDMLLRARLVAGSVVDIGQAAAAQSYSGPILLREGDSLRARSYVQGQWSPLRSVDVPVPLPPLRIAEIMYHPADPSPAERAAGYLDGDEFEFIEFVNVSTQPLDLSALKLVQTTVNGQLEGVLFDFATSPIRSLAPGGTILVVENEEAFRLRYGTQLPVAGSWSGGLANSAETITVQYGSGLTLQQVRYEDAWYPETDGAGASLEIVNLHEPDLATWNHKSAWKPSTHSGGTPGSISVTSPPGDANRDGIFNSRDLVLIFQAGKYEDAIPRNASWEEGDWNGDGDFTSADLVLAFTLGNYSPNSQTAATIASGMLRSSNGFTGAHRDRPRR